MLTRRHAEEIMSLPSLVDPDRKDLVIAWNSVHAPEEVYFPTMLSLLGYLRDDPQTLHTTQRNSEENPFLQSSRDEVWRRRVCYAEWKRRSDANPIEFTSLSVSLCDHFRRKGSLFGRKFGSNSVSVSQWRDVLSTALPLAQLKREWDPSPFSPSAPPSCPSIADPLSSAVHHAPAPFAPVVPQEEQKQEQQAKTKYDPPPLSNSTTNEESKTPSGDLHKNGRWEEEDLSLPAKKMKSEA
jgi:hypothetical protein